jgi:hypothetical protein
MPRIHALILIAISIPSVSASAQPQPGASEGLPYLLWDIGIRDFVPRLPGLLWLEGVQDELAMAQRQKERQRIVTDQFEKRIQKLRVDLTDDDKFRAARDAAFDEFEKALRENLEPSQRARLEQIRLQIQGPGAFENPGVQARLKMSDAQKQSARAILERRRPDLERTASFNPEPTGSPGKLDAEAARKLAASPEFQMAKARARDAALACRAAVIDEICATLTDAQRASYQHMRGQPFALSKLRVASQEIEEDVKEVARRWGLSGQRADPDFDTRVARPAYSGVHPRILVDEAHANLLTARRRYKPLADLLTSDGYQVLPSNEKFTSQMLRNCEILVIANASARGLPTTSGTAPSVFTEEECQAVQVWVSNGGALLLITDHEPFATASQPLATRFGVRMNKSGTADPANTDAKTGGLLFARENNLLLDHPITNGRDPSERLNRVMTFYGQGLIGPAGSTPFLKFADTATALYAGEERSAAGWAQGVALGHGRGRVVVLGEAGALSAQLANLKPVGMNVPGIDNRQMALNIMHWLSGLLEPR